MKNITICMYGASSENIDSIYLEEGNDLGKEIASRGHTLLYGGGYTGMMGACAQGAETMNGTVIGVIPYFMDEYEGINRKCTELILTNTMAERKELMEERADAFVIVPGGIGTMDEFFEIITLVELEQKSAPIILFNIEGFFDPIIDFIDQGIKKGFIREETRKNFAVYKTARDVVTAIEEKLFD
ncbi:MAG: TIGR00730 family Rossman fold protein [Eubacteriales bacterium]|nr:TIGR00730 family Rossman fold protein [Eubacteriales bacterium]